MLESRKKKAGRLDEWDDPSKKVGMPEAFSKWVEKNREKIGEADKDGRLPYFLRDNGGLWRGIAVGGSPTAGGQAAGTAAQPKGTPPAARHPHYDAIEAAKNAKEVADVLTRAGVVRWTKGLEKMSLEDLKSVAHAVAEVSERFKLDAIELNAVDFYNDALAHANGGLLEFNTGFFDKKNAANLDEAYREDVEGWVKNRKAEIDQYEKDKINDPVNAQLYDRLIAELKKKLRFSRHNVMLSRETAARDTGFHESGHVVHDQICGASNGQTFLRKNIDIKEADRLRKKSEDLFKKYGNSDDLQWLSMYGTMNFKEFFAESFVLYMCKPESLPADVRQMFEEFERFANR